MKRMISRRNYKHLLILSCLCFLGSVFSFAANGVVDLRPVNITSGSFVTHYKIKNKYLHVYSNGKKFIVSLSDGPSTYTIRKTGDTSISTLETIFGGNRYAVYIKDASIGLLIDELSIQLNESQVCDFKTTIKDTFSRDLRNAVTEAATSGKIIDSSCTTLDSNELDTLTENISLELTPGTSFIGKCLNAPEVQKQIQESSYLQELTFKILTKYNDELDKIQNSQGSLNIQCKQQKTASYDPKTNSIVLATDGEYLSVDKCKTTPQTLTHEIAHSAGFSEGDVKVFDTLCARTLNPAVTKNKDCKQAYLDGELKQPGGPKAVMATMLTQKISTQKNQKEIVQKLKQEIKTAEFVPVENSDIQTIANSTAPAEARAESAERVYNSMSRNFERIAAPLNNTLATVVNRAEAETTTASTTKRSAYKKSSLLETSSRSPASKSGASSNQEYTVEEILADKYNVPVSTVRAASAGTASAELPSTENPQTARAAGVTQKNSPASGSAELAGNAGPSAGASMGSSGGSTGSTTRSANSRQANSRLPASSGASDNTVQEMSSFSEIRGERYKKIQERYADPTFREELRRQNIAIEFKTNNMTTRIGDTSNTRKALFRDDGSVLKKVNGAR